MRICLPARSMSLIDSSRASADETPRCTTLDISITSEILTRKSIAARNVKAAIETASEIVGGAGFYRGHPMERIVRDMRAFHFHPLPERIQRDFSGRIALGMDPIEPR